MAGQGDLKYLGYDHTIRSLNSQGICQAWRDVEGRRSMFRKTKWIFYDFICCNREKDVLKKVGKVLSQS